MILLFVTLVMIIGSVAATETTSNDTTTIQSTTDNVVDSITTSATTNTADTSKTSENSTTTKTLTKTSTETSNTSTKSSTSTANSTSTSKSSTNIKVYNVTSTKGSTVTLKSVVTTTSGSMVDMGTVVFKINGHTIGYSTVSKGVATYKYTIPSNWTNLNYTITAVYAGNSNYLRSTCNSTLKLKSNLTTQITVKNITTTAGKTVTFKAVVTTTDGKYAKTGKVAFKINGITVGTTTVSNGGAKLTYTIPSNWKSKDYTITVVYGTNDYYLSSKATGTLTISGKTTPKVVVNTTSVASGKSATFITTITDASGNLVSGGKVAFKVNNKTIGQANVSKGVAKITYAVPSSWNGKYNLTVVFGEYGNYNSVRKTTTLTVIQQVSTKITINTTTATSGQSTQLIATVTDASGNKVSGGKAVFKINGKTIGTVNVTNGVAKLTYSIPSTWSGKYNITFVYGGYGKYVSSRKTTTLTVSAKSSTNTVPSGYESYVKSTTNCPVDNSAIVSLAKSLTSGTNSTYQAAVAIYNYVRDKISYTYYMNTRYGAVGTLNRKYGNCVDQTHLLIALMRASKIPARYCHATCYFSSGLVVGHVWAEVYINGKWYSCDTTSSRNSFNKIVNWYKSTTIKRYTSCYF